jgi:hypothetical protein
MEVSGAGQRLWAGNLPSSPTGVTWAGDSSGVYYAMQERGEEQLYFVALEAGSRPVRITSGRHVLTGIAVAGNAAWTIRCTCTASTTPSTRPVTCRWTPCTRRRSAVNR